MKHFTLFSNHRAFWSICAIVSFILIALIVRQSINSSNQFKKGINSLKVKDDVAAFRAFRRTASFYFPFNPWSKRALTRMETIADRTQERSLKIRRYHELNAAVTAISYPFCSPHEIQTKTEQKLRFLRKTRSAYRPTAAKKPKLNEFWILIGLLGFFFALSVGLLFIYQSFQDDLRLSRPKRRLLIIALSVGVFLFILGISLA